jgi:hypothetical protein
MNVIWTVAVLLIAAGAIGLAYGQFTYIEESHEANLGPIELTVNEKKTIDVPVWVGPVAIAAGTVLLFIPKKKPSY